tara:strand:- start:3334 stop:3804 length:471 start_codon:yes stop_codon:yes gene_type:complete
MNAINSKETPLPAPEVIIRFVEDFNDTEYPKDKVLLAISGELGMPETDQVQIGNTVFLGQRGKGEHKNVMVGRALNIDTARNFMNSGLKYIAYLQSKGIQHYRTDFNNKEYLTAFQFWFNKSQGSDTEIGVDALSDGTYRAQIFIGEESLQRFWSV